MLHANITVWRDIQLTACAKQAVLLLLHSKSLQHETEISEELKSQAAAFYSHTYDELAQLALFHHSIAMHTCFLYFCLYEAINGNQEVAEQNMEFLQSIGCDSRKFLSYFMSLLPSKWGCYNFQTPPTSQRSIQSENGGKTDIGSSDSGATGQPPRAATQLITDNSHNGSPNTSKGMHTIS